jgi:hypothetical protein
MYVYMSKHIYTAQELCWTLLESSWNINGWPTRNMPTRDGLGMYIELGTRPALIFTSRRLHPRKQAVAYTYIRIPNWFWEF